MGPITPSTPPLHPLISPTTTCFSLYLLTTPLLSSSLPLIFTPLNIPSLIPLPLHPCSIPTATWCAPTVCATCWLLFTFTFLFTSIFTSLFTPHLLSFSPPLIFTPLNTPTTPSFSPILFPPLLHPSSSHIIYTPPLPRCSVPTAT